ncbi:ABC transporter ATP-binding protein [Paenibacillus thailandensis]|uniref:ABC transporter ATP-binding protein n=1 Tax=Paenibacillus thailandensis TaxID=393250 RepID=A0ABW5QVL4_9BACL
MPNANDRQVGAEPSRQIPSPLEALRPARQGRGGPVQKPKQFKQTLRRLWGYIGEERKWLAVVVVFILIGSGIGLLGPYLIGRAVDAMVGGAEAVDFKTLHAAIIALAAAYIADACFAFLQGWLMAGVSQRVVARLRRTLFAKLHKLPLVYFDTNRHGELMSRLSNDIDNVSTSVSQTSAQLIAGGIALIGSLVMMLLLSPLLTLACLITVPLVYLLARMVTKRTSKLFRSQQAQLGKLNGQIEETVSGFLVVKAFNHEEAAVRDFRAVNDRLRKVSTNAQIWSGFMMPLLAVINNIGFAAVAIVGSLLAVKGSITVGVIASFLSYSRQFVRPLNDLANIYNVLQSGIAGAERVFEVLDEQEEQADPPNAKELADPRGLVEFDRVEFGYRSEVPLLKGISFTAEAGSSTALVGQTGAGKTTVVNLLARFYEVSAGSIRIDGVDIREYSRSSLRRAFGIVLQDTYLFAGTVKENMKYGKPDATDEEVRAAAVLAGADGFIRRLPEQYDTALTENGGNLSQGERQLLAIARAMLANPAILILDEATSSIDTRTELRIQAAMRQMMEGRTSFVIAHRLSTIRGSDQILVMERGQIAERGTHEQLQERQGLYYAMNRHASGAETGG